MPVIKVAEFTKFPTGRLRKHGNDSGQQFRDDYLIPALKKDDVVTVVLDGTSGYPASFLEEAFGGLIRNGFSLEELHTKLVVQANSPEFEMYRDLAWQFSLEASEAVAAG